MSYTLRLTDGKILVTLADQQLDTVTTSITLIGKNVNAYGDDVNTNFIHLLENFSSVTPPTSPLVGQLWFDKFAQRINVYTDSLQFKPVGGPILSETEPQGMVAGDLWIDTSKNQLSFYNGEVTTIVGPDYDISLGKSGVLVESVIDSDGQPKTVSKLYANGAVIGVVSSSTFAPRSDEISKLSGISQVRNGINLAPSAKFYGTATNAERLGNIIADDLLISTDPSPQTLVGQLGVYNDEGLSVGENEDVLLFVDGPQRDAVIATGNIQNLKFVGKTVSNPSINFMTFNSSTGYLGIFNASPDEKVHITGNVKIQGDLTVAGASTYITTQDLRVQDRTIDLAYGSSSDTLAVNGGIRLYGTTIKTFTWQSSSQAWKSSEHMDLLSGKVYKINGQTVLTNNSLGANITTAPGLTTLPGLQTITVGQVEISTTTIGINSFQPLVLGVDQTTYIDFNGKALRNAYTPTIGIDDTPDTVATVDYVKNAINTDIAGQFALQVDVTGYASNSADPTVDTFIVDMLNNHLLPPTDLNYGVRPGGRARVLATRLSFNATTTNITALSTVDVYEAGTTNAVGVVGSSVPFIGSGSVPGSLIKVDRVVKQYRVNNNYEWEAFPAGAGANIIHLYGSW